MIRYRRNILNYSETLTYTVYWHLFSFIGIFIHIFLTENYELALKSKFWIWNIAEFVWFDLFSLLLPLVLKQPSRKKSKTGLHEFYVRKPSILEPRRPNTSKYLAKIIFVGER